jgi:SAM-dependent methyltransferase
MDPTEGNRRAWDEVHRRRTQAMAGELGIASWVRECLPPLAGRHVLHLQCATGEETAELIELGALVTGVDISSEALEVARERAPNAAFIRGDVHELPAELLRGRFDLVYTGGGVLTWVLDLVAWAGGIVPALKPAGTLVLYDRHPVAKCLDAALHWRTSYFSEEVETEAGHERLWRLGQIVTALAEAGLRVVRLEEVPAGRHAVRRDPRLPDAFVLLAKKS